MSNMFMVIIFDNWSQCEQIRIGRQYWYVWYRIRSSTHHRLLWLLMWWTFLADSSCPQHWIRLDSKMPSRLEFLAIPRFRCEERHHVKCVNSNGDTDSRSMHRKVFVHVIWVSQIQFDTIFDFLCQCPMWLASSTRSAHDVLCKDQTSGADVTLQKYNLGGDQSPFLLSIHSFIILHKLQHHLFVRFSFNISLRCYEQIVPLVVRMFWWRHGRRVFVTACGFRIIDNMDIYNAMQAGSLFN